MSLAKTRLSPKATYVQFGYGQVEPNHLSARRTGQIYAQLPAAADITILENGQFAKYDYANKEVNFTGKGEWMLVFNEVKVYRDYQTDADFAMIKDNYEALVYNATGDLTYSHFGRPFTEADGVPGVELASDTYGMMKAGTTMTPRLLKTNVGDIMTTNTIVAESLNEGDLLVVGDDGYLKVDASAADGMIWQVARVYNMPDLQRGAKIVRIQ